jgi:hypothetical protein
MNRRIIRALSIGGALAATSVVAAGAQGFGSVPVSASASSSSSTPNSTPSSASVPVTVGSVAVAGSATQVSYDAGGAATVVLDSAGGTLRVVTFAPQPGWFTVRLEQPSATQLRVLLQSGSGQVHFSALFANGTVFTKLDASGAPGVSAPGNSAPGNSAPGNTAPGGGGDDDGNDNSGPGGGGSDDSGSGGGDD